MDTPYLFHTLSERMEQGVENMKQGVERGMEQGAKCYGLSLTPITKTLYPGFPKTRNIDSAIDLHLESNNEQRLRTLTRAQPKRDPPQWTLILAAESDYTPPTQAAPARKTAVGKA